MVENFLFYKSWLEIITTHIQDRNMQNELFRAIILYGIEGKKTYPTEPMFMEQVFAQIDSAKDKREKRIVAGRKGGKSGSGIAKARLENQNASKRKQNASKTQANENVNDNENVNENIIHIVNESSSGSTLNESTLDDNNSESWKDEDFDD